MSCIHAWQCSFPEGFFPVLTWGYIIFHHSPQWAPKYHFAESTTTVLAKCSKKGKVEPCVMKSHIRMQSLRKLLSRFMWLYFLFHPGPVSAPEYLFAEYTTTVLANCSKKGRVELCVMKSHITKQSRRELLSIYYMRMFPFSPWAPMGSQISLCSFHEKSVSKLLPEV